MQQTITKIPKGYKQTELGVIPEDWEICDLSEAVDFLDGRRRPVKSTDRAKVSGIYPYYGASGIVDYVNDYIFDDDLILLGEDGENILSRNLPLAFRVKGKIWVNNHAHVLKPKESFDIGYLTDYLESLDYSLLNSGTAQPKLNKHTCLKIKIAKPTKAEQTAIATVLSDTDALIERLEKLIAKKKAIKQGAMQQLLTPPKDGQAPKKRLPGFSGEWEVKKLGEIVEIKKGQLITDSIRIDGVIPVIAGGKTPAYYHNKANRHGKTITISGSGASAGYVAFHTSPIFASDCSTIEESIRYSIEFIYFFLQSIQDKIFKMQTGGAQPHIHPSDLNPIIVSVPKSEEQTAIAIILSDMDTEIESLEQKRDKYTMLKQGIMQELLTGKTRLI